MDFLLNILSHWESALAVLLVLGGLIFFHELGHLAVPRPLRMKAVFRIGGRTFSLGFGPKLLKLRRGKTDYCLSLIPLGGYVALAGEEDEAEQPDPKGKEIDGVLFAPEELYSGRPAWHRLLVVLAGPVANFVLALIIYCGIAWAQGQTYLLPEVGDVTPGTPAATAGIQPGDRVLSIDGKPIENWNAVAEGIGAGNGKPVTIVLSRGGSEVTLSLTPEAKTRANIFGEEKPAWLIGIRASTATGHLPLGPVEAIGAGFRQTWDMIAFTCESFVKLAQRVVPLDNVGGPILIAQMVGQQAEQGLSAVLLLAALISRIGAVIVVIVGMLLSLITSLNMTVASIVTAIRNRPRAEYAEPQREHKDTAQAIVDTVTTHHIEHVQRAEQRRASRMSEFDLPVDDPPLPEETPKKSVKRSAPMRPDVFVENSRRQAKPSAAPAQESEAAEAPAAAQASVAPPV